MANQDNRLQEHFWFTVAAIGTNGFLFSHPNAVVNPYVVKLVSVLISLFAAYLILERAVPDDEVKITGDSARRGRQTWQTMKRMPWKLRFVVNEFSGALFYLLLILGSCVGVLIAR